MAELTKQTVLWDALQPVYAEICPDITTEPWRQHLCIEWSQLALRAARKALRDNNYNHKIKTVTRHLDSDTQIRFGAYRHHFLVDTAMPDNPLIIDGTYLQFASEQTGAAYPLILIAPASEAAPVLQAAGVDESLWNIWQSEFRHSDSQPNCPTKG